MGDRDDKFFDDYYFSMWEDDLESGEYSVTGSWLLGRVSKFCHETGLEDDFYAVDDFVWWMFENNHYETRWDIRSDDSYGTIYDFLPTWELLDKFKLEQQKQLDLVEAQALF